MPRGLIEGGLEAHLVVAFAAPVELPGAEGDPKAALAEDLLQLVAPSRDGTRDRVAGFEALHDAQYAEGKAAHARH